jgi:peptide/nickel transport system substrate-binding protein
MKRDWWPTVVLTTIVVFGQSCSELPRNLPEATTFTMLAYGDEAIAGPMWDSHLQHLVFSTLVTRNRQGELEPSLAERWETSDEGRSWTVHLRRDVKWHDGIPFTARDVEFTLNLRARPQVLQDLPASFTLTVIDDWTCTIEFHTRSNNSIYPISAWTVVYPKHHLEHLDPKKFASWAFWKAPVGTGPYRYVRHVPKTMVEYEANPEYFGGKPRIDRVIVKFGESAVTELLAGNVDQAWVRPLEAVKLGESPDFRVRYSVSPDPLTGIAWNLRNPMFRDATVRRALTAAIDRVELRRVLNLPEEVPVLDVLVSEEIYGKREYPEALPYDPDLARQLLAEAGWTDRDGDGTRDRDGLPFQFTLLATSSSSPLAVYVQESLRRVGIQMEIVTKSERQAVDQAASGDFDAFLTMFRNKHQQMFFGRESIIGVSDDRIFAGIDSVTEAVTSLHRDAALRDLAPVFREVLPVTFLTPIIEFQVFHRRVHGLDRSGSRFVQHIEKLWIQEDG